MRTRTCCFIRHCLTATLIVGLMPCLSASAADPTNVTGCVFWLKADAGVYTNSNGIVTNWVDQVNGISVTNSAASPTVPVVSNNWQNGYSALYWSASENYGLVVPANSIAITNGQDRTVFLMVRVAATRTADNEVFGSSAGKMIDIPSGSYAGYVRVRGTDNFYANTELEDDGTYIIAVVAQSGTPKNVAVYVNGTQADSTNNLDCAFYELTPPLGVGWAIFTNGARGYLGHLGELLVYDRALGATDRDTVTTYLTSKYFASASLSVDTLPGTVIRRDTSATLGGQPSQTADLRFLWSANGTLGDTLSGWDGSVRVTNVVAGVSTIVTATNLLPATPYYWRCHVSNATGTAWSPGTNSFTTHGALDNVTDPPILPGLVLNLDASALPYTNAQRFEWWPNAMGGAIEFTANNAASANWPTYSSAVAALGNQPAVSFVKSGTTPNQWGQSLSGAIPSVGAGTNRTIFLVVIPGGASVDNQVLGVNAGQMIDIPNVAPYRVRVRNTGSLYSATNSLTTGVPHIVAVTDEGDANPATRIYVDGTESLLYTYVDMNATDRFLEWSMASELMVGGANYPDRDYAGLIAQIIIYNRVLTDDEQQDVGYFLQQKYALTGAYYVQPPRGTVIMVR